MIPDDKMSGAEGCGFFIAYLMFTYLVLTVAVAVAWNVGLYGAGLVDSKLGFWTALGLAVCINILRYVLTGLRANKTTHVDQHFHNNQENK